MELGTAGCAGSGGNGAVQDALFDGTNTCAAKGPSTATGAQASQKECLKSPQDQQPRVCTHQRTGAASGRLC